LGPCFPGTFALVFREVVKSWLLPGFLPYPDFLFLFLLTQFDLFLAPAEEVPCDGHAWSGVPPPHRKFGTYFIESFRVHLTFLLMSPPYFSLVFGLTVLSPFPWPFSRVLERVFLS